MVETIQLDQVETRLTQASSRSGVSSRHNQHRCGEERSVSSLLFHISKYKYKRHSETLTFKARRAVGVSTTMRKSATQILEETSVATKWQ